MEQGQRVLYCAGVAFIIAGGACLIRGDGAQLDGGNALAYFAAAIVVYVIARVRRAGRAPSPR